MRVRASEIEGICFVREDALTSFVAIENLLQKGELFSCIKKTTNCMKSFENKLLDRLQADKLCILSRLLEEYFAAKIIDRAEAFYRKEQINRTAFISAHKVLSFQQKLVKSPVLAHQTAKGFCTMFLRWIATTDLMRKA